MKNIDSNLLKDIISFMIDIYPSLEYVSMNEKTRIEEDLGITGDEAWDFFIEYGEKFEVDITNFLMYDYFKAEGCDFLSPVLEFLKIRKKRIKKTFTIGDLLKGIETGKLDEDVINGKSQSN